MIDTAQAYHHSEESIGQAVKDSGIPRGDIFIISKLAPRYFGSGPTKQSVDVSLEKLGTDYIDLFLIHAPDCYEGQGGDDEDDLFRCPPDNPNASWEESWKAMEKLHKQGKLRSLGVSNFYPKHLKALLALAEVPVSVVQNWFDPFYRDEATREFCQKHGIVYQGFSTLGTRWAEYLDMPIKNPILTHDIFRDLSISLDASVANIVLRWAIQKDVVVIPKAVSEKHIINNLNVLEMDLSEMVSLEIDDITPLAIDEDGEPILNLAEWTRVRGGMDDNQQGVAQEQLVDDGHSLTELIEIVNEEDETVFIRSDDGKMYALDGKSGHVKWIFSTSQSTFQYRL